MKNPNGPSREEIDDWHDALADQEAERRSGAAQLLADAIKALKGMVQLWDDNHPDDKCACLGASEDCKYPPPCELCSARKIIEASANNQAEPSARSKGAKCTNR